MKRLIAVLLGLALSTPAFATSYYVRVNGSAGNAGTSFGAAWTLAKANTDTRPGDIVYVYPGTYTTTINPDSAGSNPTGGGYITFIGAGQTTDPLSDQGTRNQIIIPSMTLSKSYVVIKGMRIASLTFGKTAARDSVMTVTLGGFLSYKAGTKYNDLSDFVYTGDSFEMGYTGFVNGDALITKGNNLRYGSMPYLGVGLHGTQQSTFVMGNANCLDYYGLTDSTHFFAVTRNFKTESDLGDSHPQVLYRCRNTTFDYCYTSIDNERTRIASYIYRQRDSTVNTHWNVDTLMVSGPGSNVMFLLSSGNNSDCGDRQIAGTVIDSSYWNWAAATGDSPMEGQDNLNGITMTYSTFVTRGRCLYTYAMRGRSTIDHCTFVGTAGFGEDWDGGIIQFYRGGNGTINYPAWGDTTLTFTNNIVADMGTPVVAPPYIKAGDDLLGYKKNYCIGYARAAIDSGGKMKQQKKLLANNNLYWSRSYISSAGDRSLATDVNGPGTLLYSRPGDSTALNLGKWENRYNTDSTSVYGDPLFRDSSMTATFDPTPASGSAAIGAGSSGSDIGAIAAPLSANFSYSPTAIVFWIGVPDTAVITLNNTGSQDMSFNFGPNAWHESATGYPKPCDLAKYGITLDHCVSGGSTLHAGGTYTQTLYYDGSTPPGGGSTTTTLAFAVSSGLGLPIVYYTPTDPHEVVLIPIGIH